MKKEAKLFIRFSVVFQFPCMQIIIIRLGHITKQCKVDEIKLEYQFLKAARYNAGKTCKLALKKQEM